MKCLISEMVKLINLPQDFMWTPPFGDHPEVSSYSVSVLGSSVGVTCLCGARCTWGFRRPAQAALWGLRLKTDPLAGAAGAMTQGTWLRLLPTSGEFMMSRAAPIGPEQSIALGIVASKSISFHFGVGDPSYIQQPGL
jgi:hypothetical protein